MTVDGGVDTLTGVVDNVVVEVVLTWSDAAVGDAEAVVVDIGTRLGTGVSTPGRWLEVSAHNNHAERRSRPNRLT